MRKKLLFLKFERPFRPVKSYYFNLGAMGKNTMKDLLPNEAYIMRKT